MLRWRKTAETPVTDTSVYPGTEKSFRDYRLTLHFRNLMILVIADSCICDHLGAFYRVNIVENKIVISEIKQIAFV